MDAIKRASFASKQLPGGQAPLASFEDLPSDELESPEDLGVYKDAATFGKGENLDEASSDCTTVVSVNTPDTLNTSNLSTPQIDSDFDSHCTLTPVDSKTHSASEFRTASLSSLSKDDDAQFTKQKKGSVVSLVNYETTETDFSQRKSSWTDIFRSHNQNSKTSIEHITSVEIKSKPVQKKKSKSESSKRELSEAKLKDKGKIFGIFKPGKKAGKVIEAVSEDSCKDTIETKKDSFQSLEDITEKTKVVTNEGKENEQPKQLESLPGQLQNDLDKATAISSEGKNSESSKTNDLRNNLNIAEKEYNIFSGPIVEAVCEKAINKESNKKESRYDHDSSESELAFDVKEEEEPVVKKDDDFEKENLLTQDSSEVEDDSSYELLPVPVLHVPQSIPIASRQQRLEVTTVPIDRPRSTTPINVAPLEAFIYSTSSTFDLKAEKIKLTLPGDQFLGRMKSPKRNTAKTWADFCEEGLHSPRMQKKGDDFQMTSDAFDSKTMGGSGFAAQDKEWVTFETKAEREDTPDLFRDLPIEENACRGSPDVSQSVEPGNEISKCSCECHAQGCENSYIKVNRVLSSSSVSSSKADVFTDKCQCQCHERFVHLWSPVDSSNKDLLSDICDSLKSSDFSTDFASFATGQF